MAVARQSKSTTMACRSCHHCAILSLSSFIVVLAELGSLTPALASGPTSAQLAQRETTAPFWGCGLLGKSIQPSDAVWKDLISDLQQTSHFKKVATWNWDIQPQTDDHFTPDFLFFPNAQCGGTSAGVGNSYLNQNAALPGGVGMSTLALGGNEPDQVGYCIQYTNPDSHTTCSGFKMKAGQCTGSAECKCESWSPTTGCLYTVSGCGMWPLAANPSSCTGQPFPFWCFGIGNKTCSPGDDPSQCCSTDCHAGMLSAFKEFYFDMANKGYTYASTPLVANDLSFSKQLMAEAGCGTDAVKQLKGQDRLKKGCPTHSAFHFYSSGCPKEPQKAVQGFVEKVKQAKELNAEFALEGTIVNELGSLTDSDAQCTDEEIATMMGLLFDHLKTGDGRGVVSQMVWFNENGDGGTFDLRLVKDGKLSKLGETYKTACKSWAHDNGVGDHAASSSTNVIEVV